MDQIISIETNIWKYTENRKGLCLAFFLDLSKTSNKVRWKNLGAFEKFVKKCLGHVLILNGIQFFARICE